MDSVEIQLKDGLETDEELKYRIGNRFKWARNALNLSRQRLIEHDHFVQIFGVYSIYKLKEVENGNFGKRNVRGELFKFLNGMARFFNIPPNSFIDPGLNKKAFERIVRKGARNKYALFQTSLQEAPASSHDDLDIFEDDPEGLVVGKPPDVEEKQARTDWADAPDVPHFYGRLPELYQLRKWIIEDRCRLVAILGMQGIGKTRLSVRLCSGGIGKTDLSLKLAHDIQGKFDCLIWRKVLNAPPLMDVLADLIRFLSDQTVTTLPETLSSRMALLLDYLKKLRCLIILDNLESILRSEKSAGRFRKGYEDYEEFFRQVGEIAHQSCVLVTSREKPIVLGRMEGKTRPVRSLELGGLNIEECRNIFYELGDFSASDVHWQKLMAHYNGNPLAMELAARHIQEVFDGDVSAFLQHGTPVFSDIQDILNWHFNRLNPDEKDIMYWLAIHRKPVSLEDLKADILSVDARENVASTIHILKRRMILEKTQNGFSLQPVLMEYITQKLVDRSAEEILTGDIDVIHRHCLVKALIEDYIRLAQIRLILKPVVERLISVLGSVDALDHRIRQLLEQIREHPHHVHGYVGGNLLNLLCHINDEVVNVDFSGLAVRQAYLAGRTLHDVNFSGCDLSGSVFTQPFGDLPSVAFSPDGKYVAAGDTRGQVHIWDTHSGQKFRTFSGHIQKVWAVAFSPDGRMLASAGTDELVRVWSVAEGGCIWILKGHSNMINSVVFRADGRILASGGRDMTVRIWDMTTGSCLAVLDHGHYVHDLAFHPEGVVLASAGRDSRVRFWDTDSFECLKTMDGCRDAVNALAFSPSGDMLATGCSDRNIQIWDFVSGKLLYTLSGHEHMICSLAFTPDSNHLISCGRDQTIRFWNVAQHRCLNIFHGDAQLSCLPVMDPTHSDGVADAGAKLPQQLPFNVLHQDPDVIRAVAICSDGRRFVSCGTHQNLCIWNLDSGKPINMVQGYANRIHTIRYHPDGHHLVTCCSDGASLIWDLTKKSYMRLKTLDGKSPFVRNCMWHPDGKHLISFDQDYRIRIWHLMDGRCIRIIPLTMGPIHSGEFSPDGRWFACFGYNPRVYVWDLVSGQMAHTVEVNAQSIRSIGFSMDSQFLMICDVEHQVTMWDMSRHTNACCLDGTAIRVRNVVSGNSSHILAGIGYDHRIIVWNRRDPDRPKLLEEGTEWIQTAVFSPDNIFLAAAGNDKIIWLWDMTQGRLVRSFTGHTHWILTLCFHPQGKWLASGGEDLFIRFWDMDTGECADHFVYPKPYNGVDITDAIGLSLAQRQALRDLGAVEGKHP